MKKINLFSWMLVLIMVFSAWSPAVAAPAVSPLALAVPLTITNPLPKATTVSIEGPKNYNFRVGAGQTYKTNIEKGSYKVKYEGCLGKKTSGKLKLNSGQYNLAIKACKMATWVIYNPSSKTFSSRLTGWMNYTLTVGPGQMQTYEMVAGPYSFSNRCGGDSWSGKVNVKGKKLLVVCR